MEDRVIIESLKNLDFEMLCVVADAIEEIMQRDGADTISPEMVKFDINLHKTIKERVDELLFAEKMVKEILS